MAATIGNPRLKSDSWGPGGKLAVDFNAQRKYERVFEAAWELAESAPVTEVWAGVLDSLLSGVTPIHPPFKGDVMAVIARWRAASDRKEEESNPFFRLRRLLAARLSSSAEHEDIAVRCGFYRTGQMTPEIMQQAFAAEAEFFLDNALENDSLWRNRATREALRELCGKTAVSEMDATSYYYRTDRLRREHPDWFEEAPPSPPPEKMLEEIAQSVKRLQAGLDELHRNVENAIPALILVLAALFSFCLSWIIPKILEIFH